MSTSEIKKTFRSSVLVIIFAALAGTIGMVVDGVFVGRYLGDIAMAAFGLASPIFLLGNTIGGLISSGVSVVCSTKLGEEKVDEAKSAFHLSLFIIIVLSLLLISVILLFSDGITSLLGANTVELFNPTKDYVLGLLLWIPSSLIMLMMQPILQLDNDKVLIFIATLITTISDIILDIVFIKYFSGGMRQMALATSISYVLGISVLATHFIKKDIVFTLKFNKFDFSNLKDIVVYGFPTATQRFSGTMRTFALNKVLALIGGTIALSALSVQSNMYNIFASVGVGLSMSTLTYTGLLVGEKNEDGVKVLIKTALKMAICLNTLVMLILYFGSPLMVSMYLKDSSLAYEESLLAVKWFSLSLPFHAISNVYVAYFQAKGDLKYSNILTFLNDFFYTFVVALVLGRIYGSVGVYASFVIGRFMTMITIYVIFTIKNKKMPRNINDLI